MRATIFSAVIIFPYMVMVAAVNMVVSNVFTLGVCIDFLGYTIAALRPPLRTLITFKSDRRQALATSRQKQRERRQQWERQWALKEKRSREEKSDGGNKSPLNANSDLSSTYQISSIVA